MGLMVKKSRNPFLWVLVLALFPLLGQPSGANPCCHGTGNPSVTKTVLPSEGTIHSPSCVCSGCGGCRSCCGDHQNGKCCDSEQCVCRCDHRNEASGPPSAPLSGTPELRQPLPTLHRVVMAGVAIDGLPPVYFASLIEEACHKVPLFLTHSSLRC